MERTTVCAKLRDLAMVFSPCLSADVPLACQFTKARWETGFLQYTNSLVNGKIQSSMKGRFKPIKMMI